MRYLNNWRYWFIFLFFCGIVGVLIKSYFDIEKYQNAQVTVAQIEDTYISSDSRYIEYVYIAENRQYREKRSVWMKGLNKNRQKFLVAYVKDDPSDHIILYNKEVPDHSRLGLSVNIELSDREIFKGITGW